MTAPHRYPVLDDLTRRIGGRPPGETVFWSGAGISVPGPTSLPTGWELTERVFRSFFTLDALATVLGHHARSSWLSSAVCDRPALRSARLPRLETVLGVAFRRFGANAYPALDDLRTAPPNWNHRFFAAHIAAGGTHITANFDTCVEDAYQSAYGHPSMAGAIEHFHERIDTSASPAELGVTLGRVQGGFEPSYGRKLVDRVGAASTTVFVGYSGSDFFDVDVTFAGLPPGRLAGREVVWVAHSDRCRWHEIAPRGADEPALGQHLARAGARVRYFCGPTSALLAELADSWSLRIAPATATFPRQVREITVDVDDAARHAATFVLYRELGMPAEVERMLATGNLSDVDAVEVWQARSETMWEQGQWNALRRMWVRECRPAGVTETMRAERIGACLWVQGRLVPAYLWLSWHRRRAERNNRMSDAWVLAETQARVVEHMARTPELRPCARALARAASSRLGNPGQGTGVHMFRRHTDLVTSLAATAAGRSRSTEEAKTSQRWFTEAGSLIAAIAYGHRVLRDSYDPDRPRADVVREYRAHFRWAAAVGSTAAAWRMILLPDADRVFSFREVVAGVFVLEYGHWQRFRIVVRSLANRVRIWLRRQR